MGYSTYHKLEITGEFDPDLGVDDGYVTLSELQKGYDAKWYDHRKEMTEMSKKYPKTLFTLRGSGEDYGQDDMWKEYYKNGKFQYVKAVVAFKCFDETKLREFRDD